MEYAIKTRPEHTTWAQLRDTWIAADDMEIFGSAWHWDHFYPLTGDLNGPNLEAWTSLAALAQATRRIRIGCQVNGMIYRHAAVTANMAATLDIIADGRLELGLGAGWNQLECDAYGIELPPLTERFDRFDEGVQVIIGLLRDEVTTFAGRYLTITNARCEPKSVQRPHPPITIGGGGPKRTLLAAAKWAQQWNVLTKTPQEWTALHEILLGHCSDVGRDPGEITCSVNIIVPTDGEFGPSLDLAAGYAEAGVDLIVWNLPHAAPPTILDTVAAHLAQLD